MSAARVRRFADQTPVARRRRRRDAAVRQKGRVEEDEKGRGKGAVHRGQVRREGPARHVSTNAIVNIPYYCLVYPAKAAAHRIHNDARFETSDKYLTIFCCTSTTVLCVFVNNNFTNFLRRCRVDVSIKMPGIRILYVFFFSLENAYSSRARFKTFRRFVV